MINTATVARLLAMAHAADQDAKRWSRDPNGGPLAAVRRRDAASLRAMARRAGR